LIYIEFSAAWLSVNQGFCGQNLGQLANLFFLSHGSLDRAVDDLIQRQELISMLALPT
jgi:hypothetical protein